jgi:hypothetical protein
MTNSTDYFAKFAEILNRNDVYIRTDISCGFESYKIFNNGVVLLAVRKHIRSYPNTHTEDVVITCEMPGYAMGATYKTDKKMPNNAACKVYRLMIKKYKEQQKILVGTQKTKG